MKWFCLCSILKLRSREGTHTQVKKTSLIFFSFFFMVSCQCHDIKEYNQWTGLVELGRDWFGCCQIYMLSCVWYDLCINHGQ